MMRCKEIEPLLSELIDEELSPRLVWEVESHLSSCNSCTLAFNDLRRTVGVLKTLEARNPSPLFNENLLLRIQAARDRRSPRWDIWIVRIRRLVFSRTVAAAVLAAILGVAVFSTPRWLTKTTSPEIRQSVVPRYAAVDRSEFMAMAVNDPLQDVSAINLESHSSTNAKNNRVSGAN